MSTEKQSYHKRVRAIAEESIQSFISECQKEDNTFALIGADKENLLQLFLPAARIVVKRLAETARSAYLAANPGHYFEAENYLREQGLIPDQEGGEVGHIQGK